jgi:hypothetical protein
MLWCIDGSLTRERVRALILDPDNTDYNVNYNNMCVTNGRLNAFKVVAAFYEPCNHTNLAYNNQITHHRVICLDCNIIYNEYHNYRYSNSPTNLSTHSAFCINCDYTCAEGHVWVTYGTKYRCSKCLLIADAIPGIMQIPSDDELLSDLSSDNEMDTALLPEREDDFVTE